MRYLMTIITCALCAAAFAMSPDNCTLYAPFDGGFDAAASRGSGKAEVKGNVQFVPGIRGQGILVGAPETGLSYATTGNFDLEAGTISIWVKPVTWDDTDAAMRFFVGISEGAQKSPQDGGTFLWLYRYFSRSTYFLVWDSRDQATVAGPDPIAYMDYMKKGEWCHLVGTWNGDELRMYINGVFQSVARVTTPRLLRSIGDHFTVGDPNRANTADTVLDELRIFDRALTAPEVAALYKFELSAQPNQLEVTAVRLPGANKVKVDVNALAFKPSEATALSARLLLQSKGGDKTLAEQTCAFSDSQHLTTSLSTAGLPVGQYRVVSTLMKDGKSLATTETPLSLNPPPKWLGSKVGVTDKVLAPWTPIQVRNTDSAVRNPQSEIALSGARSYTVGDALLPSGIFTGGRTMLSGPIALSGTVNGTTFALTKAKTTWSKKTPARVEFMTSASSGNLTATANSFVEPDGLLWTRLRLQSKSPVKISQLTLDIPFSKEAATLMHTAFTWQDSGAVRRWNHRVVAFSQIWMGNEDGGVEWTIPSARNWFNTDRNRQIEIIPEDNRVVLRLNLIDKETTIGKPNTVEYEFGIQLTPVRPHPAGWRMWRVTPPEGTPGTRFNPFFTEGWAVGTSYPIPKPEWESILANTAKNGNIPVLYFQLSSVWAGLPDYPDFAAEWRTRYCSPPTPPNPKASPTTSVPVCPRTHSWSDYLTDTFCDLMQGRNKDLPWGGVYFDCAQTMLCDNADHGCGYKDEYGVLQPEQRFLEHREVQKRFYAAMQERWPDKLIFNHQSTQVDMMQLPFCHGMIDGETLTDVLTPNFNYYNILTLDRMRAGYMGHNYGYVPIFLPEFTRGAVGNVEVMKRLMEDPEPAAVLHLVGLLFLHDILPWDAYSNASPYYHLWAVQDAFGWGDEVEFLPYWKNREFVTLSPSDPNLVCTIYRRPGKLMLVAMNNTDEDREVTLQLNEEKLGVHPSTALDAWKGTSYKGVNYAVNPQNKDAYISSSFDYAGVEERLPVESGKLTVKVGQRNFRLLTVQP